MFYIDCYVVRKLLVRSFVTNLYFPISFSQSVLQMAEFMFKDTLRSIGYEINKTLESIPIISTVKNVVSKATQTIQV